MSNLTPQEIIKELDRYVVGQNAAKRACAVALRNRWRRKKIAKELRHNITPKNIMLVGPTGVGKTELVRRVAQLARAPFIKVDATKFTEVGYVGRDVESIIVDLVESTVRSMRLAGQVKIREQAEDMCRSEIVRQIAGLEAATKEMNHFGRMYDKGKLDERDVTIEIRVLDKKPESAATLVAKEGGTSYKMSTMTVSKAKGLLVQKYMRELCLDDGVGEAAVAHVEESGIVFIDEVDKLCMNSSVRSESVGVSREGVQRDLLPLLEGSVVQTKYGLVRTDHILFVACGAFHVSKTSDLLPEFQGRFPTQVLMESLQAQDFYRILQETESCLISQYQALLGAEGLTLEFEDSGIRLIAEIACKMNRKKENIGARRLHTVLESVLEDLSFEGPSLHGKTIVIDRNYVQNELGSVGEVSSSHKYVL